MARINIEEFGVCHQLAEDIKFILPLAERSLIHITHLVGCDEFLIFIEYNKSSFGDDIKEFVQKVIKTLQESSLYSHGWAVHRPLIYDARSPDYSDFSDQIQITITTNLKKCRPKCRQDFF